MIRQYKLHTVALNNGNSIVTALLYVYLLWKVIYLTLYCVMNLYQYNKEIIYLLRSLHWLPVAARTEYKTLMLAYKATKGMAPTYLANLIAPYKPSRALRSAEAGKLVVPSLKTPGQRSTRPKLFSLLAPKLWNALPITIRTAESLPIFRRNLKTHLFRRHYGV